VSTEMRPGSRGARALTTGSTRSASWTAETGRAPGRVDSPPMSTNAAPSAAMPSAKRTDSATSTCCPPSENESGVTFRMPIRSGVSRRPDRGGTKEALSAGFMEPALSSDGWGFDEREHLGPSGRVTETHPPDR